ncbi:MAG: ABC transporter ATP-binding protein [Oscillospiraceae bacterium]
MARNKFDTDEKLETPFNFGHLKRAGKYIKKHKAKMILSLILSLVSVVFALFGPKIIQKGIDEAIPNRDIKLLIILSILLLITIIISVILTKARSKYMTIVGQEIVYELRQDLFEHLQKLSFQYYDDRPHGKILTRVINYVNNVSDMLSNGIINFILEIFNLVIIAIFMFGVSPQLTLVVLAGVPILVLIICLIRPAQRRAWQKVSNKSSNLNAYLHESLDGAKITQAFVREEENAKIFDDLNKKCKKTWLDTMKISNLVWYFVDNISTIVVAVMYFVGVIYLRDSVKAGMFIAMSSYAWRFWQPILNLSNLYNNFINTIAYLERIFETMDEPVIVNDIEGAAELPRIEGKVTFEDVTFSYDGSVNVLENINFNVNVGESIAFVGPTGAGKTTIVNLISRFYNLNGGRVLIDGNDIALVTQNSLRRQMGIMLQDSFIFSGTIIDNVKYGRLDATDEEVIEACKIVRAHDFIMQMDKGYHTQVNERGSRLSGGQKQLIAFARTLLADPKILILDEATSSIDAKTEKLLQDGLQQLLKNRTSFIIAHRLSTIKNCDKIMYVANKKIVECGSHDELMGKHEEYFKLYTAQLEM